MDNKTEEIKRMRKAIITATAALVWLSAYSKGETERLVAERDALGTPVVPGVWHAGLEECKQYAEENGLPLIAVWSNGDSCPHCTKFENCLTAEPFEKWRVESGIVLMFAHSGDPRPDGPQRDATYNWCWGEGHKLGYFPFVRFYWKKDGVVLVDKAADGDTVDNRQGLYLGNNERNPSEKLFVPGDYNTFNIGSRYCIYYITNGVNGVFKDYVPAPVSKYSGGIFRLDESDNNRLEAEAGTAEISIVLERDENVSDIETNNFVRVVGPGGDIAQEINVEWVYGQTSQQVALNTAQIDFAADGDQAFLMVVDAEGNALSTNSITYVEREISESNPLWIGERTAETLQWGEWTMDFDVAKAKAASADGEAYTIVSIQGSLWCPDCNNVDRNFMGVKDGTGVNRFEKWAKQNNVALVAIDVPSFADAAGSFSSPTLLSRTPYTSTLARAREYPASGADESLLTPMLRSGLGYLTRKGVDDATAAATLERNRRLVTTDVSQGGFHSAADSNPNRTGVPIFVVLDKNGNVKARLTRFASVSPMADVSWDDVIKRFDELLAIASGDHDDGGVLENDFPDANVGGFTVNGGKASGEISHCDFRDVYSLNNFDGNGFLLVEADGESTANVALSLVRLDANGRKETIATSTGPLNDGVFLAEMIDSAGAVYVEIAGVNFNDAFSPTNPSDNAFYGYTLGSEVILVPGETRSTASAPEGSDTISLILEEGETYRIEGLADEPGEGLEKTGDNFYVATAADFDYVSLKTASVGGEIVYQLWKPGNVGFTAENKTVTESVGDVRVEFARTEGTSGAVTVRVSLDENATTLYNSDGEARFGFEATEITWAEGESGTTNVVIRVLDDARFDGPGVVALKIEVVADENADTELGTALYTLTVKEDDKQSPGKAAFTAADPFFAKKATVYARESEGATVYAERIEASDGYVTAKVTSSTDAKIEIRGEATDTLVWANHRYDRQPVKVTGIPAGKSAKITLASPTDGLKIMSASNTVTIVSVADDAPEFETNTVTATIHRYVSAKVVCPVKLNNNGALPTFTKLSGTLPAGLSSKYDSESSAMVISGAPTAKAGTYVVTYQVAQKIGTKTVPGLTAEITLTVDDPTTVSEGAVYNEAVATSKTRTFKDVAFVKDGELIGLLQVTIPAKGNASAKYIYAGGTISLSAKNWSECEAETAELTTILSGATKKTEGWSLVLLAAPDGGVDMTIRAPDGSSSKAWIDGSVWSAKNTAEAYAGYYTVTLPVSLAIEETEGFAPTGSGYLTVKIQGTSAINSGKATWAGLLPNGTAFSGSTILTDGDTSAMMPLLKASSKDYVAGIIRILRDAAEIKENGSYQSISATEDCPAINWVHTEPDGSDASFEASLGVYGGIYDKNDDLESICREFYDSTDMFLFAEGVDASSAVSVSKDKVLLDKAANALSATLSFNKTTGIVSGTFTIPVKTGNVKASWRGVVLPGWNDCGCSDTGLDLTFPFVTGAFYYNDRITYETTPSNGKTKTLSVRRGGKAKIDCSAF